MDRTERFYKIDMLLKEKKIVSLSGWHMKSGIQSNTVTAIMKVTIFFLCHTVMIKGADFQFLTFYECIKG